MSQGGEGVEGGGEARENLSEEEDRTEEARKVVAL